jgi:subtilisin family serine protease
MKIWVPPARLAVTVVVGLLSLWTGSLWSQGGRQRLSTVMIDGREAADGEVIVRYRDNMDAPRRAHAEFTVNSDRAVPTGRRGWRRLRSRAMTTRQMLDVLRSNPDVEFAEPNYVIRLNALPNDSQMPLLWGMFNQGQSVNGIAGVPGADIKANSAWNFTTGSRDQVVGVIDTGIDYDHPDLNPNMWRAPRAFTVTIGGFQITCAAGTYGFNAIARTCNPMDDHSHGTHVAGTIGAVGNNGIGVAGVNWVASMMALKFLDSAGDGFTSDAIDAIEFAIQAKAALGGEANIRVLSNSWAGAGFSQALRNQIDAAASADMLFVAAAGNSTANTDVLPEYPGAYSASSIISVAALTNRDELSSFSNYGAVTVDIGAPGSHVLSTTPGGSYGYKSGTSMAAPHVAGAAALLLSVCPGSTDMLKTWLLNTADPIAALAGITTTGGRLNVDAALRMCLDFSPTLSASLSGNTIRVSVVDGPGRPRDWVGLYCPSGSGDSNYVQYRYLNNQTAPPSVGVQSASVTFMAPSGSTTCDARLFFNGGMLKLATSNTIDVTPAPPAITVSSSQVGPGDQILVTLANGPGSTTDWVALFPQGGPSSAHQQWRYMNGLQVAPAIAMTSASTTFVAPSTPGIYEVRWLANNSQSVILTSPPITVATQPRLSINDVTVTEGNSGTATTATFTVSLSPANPTQTVTVNVATADGTATTANADYAAASTTLTFAPSQTSRTFNVLVNGDTAIEPTESFVVNLSGAVNAALGDAQGVGTIVSDDAPPGPSVVPISTVVHPGAAISFEVFHAPGNPLDWVTLTPVGAPDSAYVQWMYLDGSRVPPMSGASAASLQFIAPLVPGGTYDIRLFADNRLTRLATSAPITVATPPTLTIADIAFAEGNSGTGVALATVTLSPQYSHAVTVAYATTDGTATTANNDYATARGTLTFDPGVTTQIVAVAINGDTALEVDETVLISLSSPVNAVIGDGQGIITITNDDGPAVSIAAASVAPGGQFEALITDGPGNPQDWVALVPVNGADNGYHDWFYLNGTKTAPATGLVSATVQFVAPSTPGLYNVRLFANNQLARLATSNTVSVAAVPTLAIGDVSVTEGQAGTTTATFTVTLSPANTTETVTVGYVTGDGTATVANADYAPASGTLTFSPSQTTRTMSVAVNGDTANEPHEFFVVNLVNPVNAAIGDGQGIGHILSDDATAPSGPSATVSIATAAPGDIISVSVAGGPANRTDWVAIVMASGPDHAYQDWKYLNNSKTAPGSGVAAATVQLTAPSVPGVYHVRFFSNNVLNMLATSSTFTVQ